MQRAFGRWQDAVRRLSLVAPGTNEGRAALEAVRDARETYEGLLRDTTGHGLPLPPTGGTTGAATRR